MKKLIVIAMSLSSFVMYSAEMANVVNEKANLQLLDAARSGNIQQVNEALEAGASLDFRDYNQYTPLHIAAQSGKIKVIDALIDAKADTEARQTNLQWTSLHYASYYGYIEAVKALILGKADIEARTDIKNTPLFLAASNGGTKIVNELILAKADVDARDNNQFTPLHMAAKIGHIEVVKLLILAKATIDAKNINNQTPLQLAAKNSGAQIVNELILSKSHIDARDNYRWTALHYAANYCHLENVDLLLKAGASSTFVCKNHATGSEQTIFDLMERVPQQQRKNQIIRLITEYQLKDFLLIDAVKTGNIELLKKALAIGANVNFKDANDHAKQTPLHWACANGNLEIIKVLIDARSSIDVRNNNRQTPLHLAALNSQGEILKVLLSNIGADSQLLLKENESIINLIESSMMTKIIKDERTKIIKDFPSALPKTIKDFFIGLDKQIHVSKALVNIIIQYLYGGTLFAANEPPVSANSCCIIL